MATRNNTFILKRSNVVGKIPSLSGLTLGELALNTADAKLYTLYTAGSSGATEVRQVGWDSPDNYVTGGTYSNGTLTLNRQNGSVTVNGLLSADTYVTGFTYSNNNLTIQQNQGQSPLSVNISTMTGLTVNGTVSATTYAGETTNFGLSLDGQSGIISTGQKGYTIIPYNMTITGWNIVASPSGSCQFDVWKIASGSALPTVSNTITGSQKPILSNGYIATSTSVSGWTTTVTTGDIIGYNVDSASGITKVTLSINGTKR